MMHDETLDCNMCLGRIKTLLRVMEGLVVIVNGSFGFLPFSFCSPAVLFICLILSFLHGGIVLAFTDFVLNGAAASMADFSLLLK